MKIDKIKTYVVCYNWLNEPSTWGHIVKEDDHCYIIRYDKDAPKWESDIWDKKYVAKVNSKEEAKKIIDNYLKLKKYIPEG